MNVNPTKNEKHFSKDEFLVTKTDLKGRITYANKAFTNIVEMCEDELLNQPHNVIRHPDMPKIIFKLLWNYLQDKKEIHAYVKNLCADGSFYWVMANVTPSFYEGKVIGYHSVRRKPTESSMKIIAPLYQDLLRAEKQGGISASEKIVNELLISKGVEYDEFILSI